MMPTVTNNDDAGINQNPTNNENLPIQEQNEKEVKENENRKLTSQIWEHFVRKKIDGEYKAVCNYCNSILSAKGKSGTSHLWDHYRQRCKKRKHTDIRQLILKSKQKKGETVLDGYHSFNPEVARKKLVTAIILHEYPLSVVDHEAFREYSEYLQPLFNIPSRNTVRADILNMYKEKMEKTMRELEKIKGRVSITSDMWTADHQKKGYMAVTAHYIDDTWRLQKRVLRFCYVPSPHTSELVAKYLMMTFMDWNIDRKLCTITLDNCSVNDGIIENVKEKVQGSDLLLDGEILHMRCAAHIINLVVQDGLSVIGQGIERIRDSVVYWTATPKRVEMFENTVRQLGIQASKKLSLDVRTRWNSTYLMLESALPYKIVFLRLKQREKKYKALPSDDDWLFASDICKKLKLFFDITELFSGTMYPTANLYFPKLCDIKLSLDKWLCDPDAIINTMAHEMKKKFEKYWEVVHGVMGLACILDPRYKLDLVQYYFEQIYGDMAESKIMEIRLLFVRLLIDYEMKFASNESIGISRPQLSDETKVQEHMEGYLPGFALFQAKKRKNRGASKTDLDRYLEDEVLPMTSNFDILTWWKLDGPKYPTLQAIARDVLAIPVSTVASESCFSTGDRLISPHRSRLHPNIVEALACCQNWLLAEKSINAETSCTIATILDDDEEMQNEVNSVIIDSD